MNAAVSPHIFDVDQANFETEVLQASLTTPVLVDFWAEWCGPCKSLGPMLEKLAVEYNGAFRLGKVDVDKNQELAGIFGIRSIPTVILVKDGQILDGFAGALPEGQLRQFLSRHVQPLEGELEEEAEVLEDLAPESPEEAINRLQQEIAASPNQPELKLDLAIALAQAGHAAAAENELNALPANLAADTRAVRLRSQLDLARSLEGTPAMEVLQQRVHANPQDWEAHDLLGVRLLLGNDPATGLEHWLLMLEKARDWNEGQAKKRLLAAFNTLDDAELVGRYRRRMASLLF
ncbi:thioredoxin [Dyella nitratireducens]|uniref:Thioredoxin n=1 Tax=Dyella nitratireducens TaxID=1849580 RepID=A0ABQ1G2V3_9GAMM|nr:thioredoxin [Dyella nitratireducens]GGA35769.1 co-chaperone YbbN [Dyella nitratireducens]GLQ41044.1 co-chaperone YbbN [Dyella nitratireducens]